jgi:hypothetical protein
VPFVHSPPGQEIITVSLEAGELSGTSPATMTVIRQKRRGSCYESGRRSGAWVKMRVNHGQELVVGGYVPASKNFDSIVVGITKARS